VIVPVALDVPLEGFTFALKVTGEFCATEDAEAVNVVVVFTAAEITFTVIVLEVEPLKVLFPLYSAVMEFCPIGREDVDREAVPPESDAVPIDMAPL